MKLHRLALLGSERRIGRLGPEDLSALLTEIRHIFRGAGDDLETV